jgi:hypothetical protein
LIDIVEPDDIVFADIAADLNLDQLKRDFSGIRESVF